MGFDEEFNNQKKKQKKNPLKLKKEEKVKKYRYVKESDNLRRFDYRERLRGITQEVSKEEEERMKNRVSERAGKENSN